MKKGLFAGITVNIILLGIVSFLTDMSSEIIRPIIPLFVTALGAGSIAIGFLGGLVESVTAIVKVFSGYWSDRLGRRKPFLVAGYSLSSVAKLFLAAATTWWHVLILKPLERIGKLRDPPRDAIMAETTPKAIHGKVFGFHRAADTVGAVLGSIIAFLLLWLAGLSFKIIILIAAIISFSALIILPFVKEKRKKPKKFSLRIGLRGLSPRFKLFIAIVALFALGNFSYMFFILKAGLFFTHIATPVLLYVLFNASYALFAFPLGILSDKIGRKNTLIIGYLLFGAVCASFAFFETKAWFITGFVLYGLSFASIVGIQRVAAADLAAKEMGTALGTFYTVIGLVALPASIIAGLLWHYISPQTTFIFGAAIAAAAAGLFAISKLKV